MLALTLTLFQEGRGCEGEGEHTLNTTLTLKLTQQSSKKRTKEIQDVHVNTVNRLKELKSA